MKNKTLISGLIACGAIFLLLSPALALEVAPEETPEGIEASVENEDSESPDELIAVEEESSEELTQHLTTYFEGGQSIVLKDHYLSDVIVAGQSVTISPDAIIEGDLIVGAQSINIYGTINGDIRAGGSSINLIGATVTRNASLFGAQITTDEDTVINGDLTAYGGMVATEGTLNGNMWAGAGDITLNNTVLGTVYVDESGPVKLGEDANIAGDLNYKSSETATIDTEAVISGATTYTPAETAVTELTDTKPFLTASQVIWEFVKLLGLLLVGVILIYLFPKKFEETTQAMFDNPGKSFLRGLAWVILTPLVLGLLMLTIIGIPFSIIGFILYGLALYLATLAIGLALGQKIMPKATNLFWPLILGTTLFYIAKLVPYAGGILGFLGILWAVGAFSMACHCCKKSKKSKK